VVVTEKIDEVAHFGLVRRKLLGALGDFDKAISVTCLFHFGKQEVEHDKIEMLNFVSAAFDELSR
jgi:hypothetical protein